MTEAMSMVKLILFQGIQGVYVDYKLQLLAIGPERRWQY